MRRWGRARAPRVSNGLNMALLLLCAGLASLASNDLFRVLDALALVWLGGTHAPHLRGDLADQLFVGAGDGDRVALHREGDPLWRGDQHRVRITYLQHEVAG